MTSHDCLKRHLYLPALAVGVLALAIAGCTGQNDPAGQDMPPPAVDTSTFDAQDVPLISTTTGRLAAFREAHVRARVSGVLLERTYSEGTQVEKGQQLFQIDPAPLQAALEAAQATLAQARSAYTNSHVAAERARKLVPKGYVSQADVDNAEAQERTDRAAIQAAQAAVKDAQIKLDYAKVTAPIAGEAGKQQVTEGDLVGQGEATLLTTVRQIDPLYVNFTLPIEQLESIRTAQSSGKATLIARDQTKVTIQLPGGADYTHAGTMDFSDMFVNPSTGSVSLRAKVPNPEHILMPGMYTNVDAHLGTLNDAFLLPQSVVLRDDKSAYVLVVDDDNIVQRKNLVTRGMQGGNWLVTDGITADDAIIVEGIPRVQLGQEADPTPRSADDAAADAADQSQTED